MQALASCWKFGALALLALACVDGESCGMHKPRFTLAHQSARTFIVRNPGRPPERVRTVMTIETAGDEARVQFKALPVGASLQRTAVRRRQLGF